MLVRYPWLNSMYGAVYLAGASLFRRYPASRGPGEIDPPPFFIVGAARSGNTLLRALLVGHTEISIPPESYVLGTIARKWDRINFLDWGEVVKLVVGEFESHPEFHTWNTALSPVYETLLGLAPEERSLARVIDAVYRHYSAEKSRGFRVWGDKTPLNTECLPSIDRVFPDARYIHVIRDGRDAVSSAVEAGLFGGSVEAVCRQWLLRVGNASEFGRRVGGDRYMELRYEDLVTDAGAAVRRVCAFLGVAFEAQMMEHSQSFDTMGDTGTLEHHANVRKPITSDSIGKWKQRLTEGQIRTVERMLRHRLDTLGYD
jgi:protein-tyrosine sulfotransferase